MIAVYILFVICFHVAGRRRLLFVIGLNCYRKGVDFVGAGICT